MKIISIEMTNWRAYSSVAFDFSRTTKKKNCVLIGAENGFGKTSFFEAITLCLYGKSGFPLLARATDQALGKQQVSYDKFMGSVIHKDALMNCPRVVVKIVFQRTDGAKIVVERHWHFNASAVHKPGDEQFTVQIDGDFLTRDEADTEEEWQDNIVKQHFVPQELARFFLFDGEMVRDLAKMEMETQVRMGIEGLMGIPILRELKGDLDKYGTKRRGEVKTARSEYDAKQLADEIDDLRNKSEDLERGVGENRTEQQNLTAKHSNLVSELGNLGITGSQHLKSLYEEMRDEEVKVNQLRDNLQDKLTSEFSMALAGKDVIRRTIKLLNSDSTLDDWIASQKQGTKGRTNFIRAVEIGLKSKDKGIPSEFHSAVVSLIESTWSSIWHPKPKECPEEISFGTIRGTVRGAIVQHLSKLDSEAGKGIEDILSRVEQLQKDIHSKENEIRNLEAVGPRNEVIMAELSEVGERLKALSSRIGVKTSELEAVKGDLHRKTGALNQITSIDDRSQPVIKLAKTADRVSRFISGIIAEVVPIQSSSLEREMSKIYSELSSKDIVRQVSIASDSFAVKLVGDDEQDIRENTMSAGEEQIFSQSLISAVVEVSNFDFPMVIDTPLARLDDTHRKSILGYLKNLSRQVIFLSTDTEIIGEYFDVIEPNVSDSYLLTHRQHGGVGYTGASRGYFE